MRTVVKWATIITAVTFAALQVCFRVFPEKTLLLSAISFCWVEICLAYNTEAFWVLVEESCNIQQARKTALATMLHSQPRLNTIVHRT
eukprot:SAG31_NODE_44158_length_264_cov_0.618182_1_plen_87_part_11